jgi:hypothetical protein
MQVRKTIDDLRLSLEHVIAEEELLQIIFRGLETLRQSFLSDRLQFSPTDINFLQSLSSISDNLRKFIELKEELLEVRSLMEFEDLMDRLTHTNEALAGFRVATRVAKEIRELREKLPTLRDHDEAHKTFHRSSRIVDLEQKPPRCSKNHPMVVRDGRHGYFWGCSRYPLCMGRAQLTAEQQHILA